MQKKIKPCRALSKKLVVSILVVTKIGFLNVFLRKVPFVEKRIKHLCIADQVERKIPRKARKPLSHEIEVFRHRFRFEEVRHFDR